MKSWIIGVFTSIITAVVIYWLTEGFKFPYNNDGAPNISHPVVLVPAPEKIITPNYQHIKHTSSLPQITIDSLQNNATVDVHEIISGRISIKNTHLWIVIHPIETQDCWVQLPVSINKAGEWIASVQFGEKTSAHNGKKFEVRALADKNNVLKPGRTRCWPKVAYQSASIYVERYKDN